MVLVLALLAPPLTPLPEGLLGLTSQPTGRHCLRLTLDQTKAGIDACQVVSACSRKQFI